MEAHFNKPQRQSSIGIFIVFIDSLQKIIRVFWPFVLVVVFNTSKLNRFFIISGIFVFIVLLGVFAYLRYLNFNFYIDDVSDEFVISEGIINKTKTTIPLNKIQQVHIHQNLIQRIIGVYSLSIDTAGSDKTEGTIKAIAHSLALALKAKLLENDSNTARKPEHFEAQELLAKPLTTEPNPFLKISFLSLFKVGITSNYVKSLVLILTFFCTIFDNLRNLGKEDLIDSSRINQILDNYPLLYSILLFVIVIFTIIFLINISRTIIKYFDYSIKKQNGSLLLSYGLINTESTILKPEKVQIVSVSRNFFQKKLNVLEIKIKQAVSDEIKQKRSLIEIPGCSTTERDQILKLIFKQLPEKGLMMQPNFRKLVFSIFLTIIVPLTGFYIIGKMVDSEFFQYTHFAVFYAVFILILLFFGFRNYRLFISNNHIIKQSGVWDINREIIEIKKIQAITSSQLFWHKNLNIGSLTMHTAAGNLTFYLGNYSIIQDYINLWLYEIELTDSNWM